LKDYTAGEGERKIKIPNPGEREVLTQRKASRKVSGPKTAVEADFFNYIKRDTGLGRRINLPLWFGEKDAVLVFWGEGEKKAWC